MKATILTFKHGTHTQREVVISTIHSRSGKLAYVTIDAYGNSKSLFRFPTARYVVGEPETVELPDLQWFLHITDLIQYWKELTRGRIEDSVSYSVAHDGMDTVYYGDTNVVLPSQRDKDILQYLVKKQAQLAARIRETVNQERQKAEVAV